MTPEQIQQLNSIEQKLDQLIDVYYRQHNIDSDVFVNPVFFKGNVSFFKGDAIGQQPAITPPVGGTTIDAQARTAINSIIALSQTFNFTE